MSSMPKKQRKPPLQRGPPAATDPNNKAKATNKITKKRRKDKRYPSFRMYIHKVLKSVHPDIGISKKGMEVMNAFIYDMMQKIAQTSQGLDQMINRQTMTSRQIESATKLLLPGQLARHAVSEGTKAVRIYKERSGL